MNNLPIKFLSVEIRNFRGIPDVLQIPLDAPLTVIHAANGSGKSTICYALEWLLTNKVDDLPTTTDFSCQWGAGDTSVSADCVINGESYYLERVKGKASLKRHGGRKKRIADTALLEMLTPSSVKGSSTQATTKARRDWLRNCRWLYANSLALLVDNSKSELRQQIFADILGLGHLAGTLGNLKEYRGELPRVQGLEKKLENLITEIESLEEKLSVSQSGREQMALKLSSILEKFPDARVTGNQLDDFKTAQLEVARLLQTTQHKKNLLNMLLEGWQGYESGLQQLENSRSALANIIQSNTTLSEDHRQLAEKLATVETQIAQGKLGIEWAKKNTDVLNGWKDITSGLTSARLFPQTNLSLQFLEKNFVEYGWDRDKQQRWLNSVEYLLDNQEILLDLLNVKRELSTNPVQPPANLVDLLKSVDAAKQARITAQGEFDALSNVINRLKALGQEAVHSLSSGHCPLCDHDWASADALRKQLANANLAPELQAASHKLMSAQSNEQLRVTSLQHAQLQQSAFEDYVARVKSVNDRLKVIEERTNYLSIMAKPEFSDSDIANFPHLLVRIKSAIGTRNIAETLSQVEEFFQLPPSLTVNTGVSEALQVLARYTQNFQQQLDSANAERPSLTQTVREKLESIQAKTRESHQINASIAAVSPVVDSFQRQWNEVVGTLPVSKNIHAATQAAVEVDIQKAEGYEAELRDCQILLSIDSDTEQLIKLRSERAVVAEKLSTGQSRILVADNAITQYGDHVRNATVSSLAPLLVPATELFSRMHANEVYHQLSVSGNDLNWMVLAEGHETPLAAEEKLSQGQRQDLALSLYLARAKNTGGSFLLDEPIAHLDDLNRVAMLDIFRLVATSMPNMNLILTTASDSLARHLAQKFSSLPDEHLLNTIYLEGNPRTGVKATVTRNAICPAA
ncbi:DNA repair ATPase [Aeromonas hydrophila]|uniref:AAA family ATPase n=1 Tax=Aeromonas hydrophila TaxID=644 RepID=UPI0005365414|nr:AAA family ATPase [Aeromonas hydrophila]KHA57571.1 DNA repair ATPase [Aeromonas hydrophila]